MSVMCLVGRAARHGHQLNGKLARLAQQEAAQMSTLMSDSSSCVTGSVLAEHRERKSCQGQKKKRKKKKKRLKRSGTEES